MTFVPAPGILQVNQRATLYGQQIENVHYFELGFPPDPAGVQQAADDARDNWVTHMMPVLTEDYIYREAYVTDLTTQTSPAATAVPISLTTGAGQSDAAPGSVTLCLSLRTSGRGRSSRGRQYISGLSEGSIIDNAWDSTKAAEVVTAFQAYQNSMNLAGYNLVVLSRISEGNPRDLALAQAVTGILTTDLFIDSQRRRLTGRGR
jgi:hypothetical protein